MRKLCATMAAMLFLLIGVQAQILNPSFESWTSNTYKIPFGFPLSSIQETIQNNVSLGVTQATPGHSGSYAIRLETQNTSNGPNASYMVTSHNDPMKAKDGFPYGVKPDSLFMYAKYQIATGDTAVILILFKKNAQVICQSVFQVYGTSSVWKRLAYKIQGLAEAPDSIIFAMASSNALTNQGMVVGSNITVDDISFNTSPIFPGGDFEVWSNYTIESPNNWMTNEIDPSVGNLIERTSDTPFGSSAVKIKTVGNSDYGFVNGLFNGQTNNNNSLMGGFNCVIKEGTLTGYYKYFPIIATDTANVSINFYKNGNQFAGNGSRLMPVSSYQKFEVQFKLNQVPDLASIRLESTNWPWWLDKNSGNNEHSPVFNAYMNARVGSILYADNLVLTDASLALPIIRDQTLSLTPNPANRLVEISIPEKFSAGYTVSIFDLSGKLMLTEEAIGTTHIVDISSLANGVYQTRIVTPAWESTVKLMVRK